MSRHQLAASAPALIRQAYQTYHNPPQYELYDLSKDPNEFTNLAQNPEYAATLATMLSAYRDWQQEVRDPFVEPENLRFWIEEQNKGRTINYRKDKAFQWGYLRRFQAWREQQ